MQAQYLLELQVKALAQPLGSENAWSELGDGRVEYHAPVIRVVASTRNHCDQHEEREEDTLIESVAAGEASSQQQIILEDTIMDDTPFVGENSCIVWNSIEQELSLCIMFNSEFEFQAAWSALAAMQHKPYPPIGKDLLSRCHPDGAKNRTVDASAVSSCSADDTAKNAHDESEIAETPLPYDAILHTRYSPPLGTIERHALALSLMEFGHLQEQTLYSSPEACAALLKLGHADLLENLVSPSTYPLFLKGLDPSGKEPKQWVIPDTLKDTVKVAPDFENCIRTMLCLHHLKHNALPLGVEEEAISVIDGVNHRLQNETACSLLADDGVLKNALEELDVIPVQDMDLASSSRSATPTEPAQANPISGVDMQKTKEMPSLEAERHVADHLHFFTSLISLSISAFSKELVAPVMGKIFSHGLLEAMSRVADRFTIPSPAPSGGSRQTSPENQATSRPGSSNGLAPVRPAPTKEGRSARPPRLVGPRISQKFYSKRVEEELSLLLDATIVRLNEKQEEVAMNDFFRVPILDNPEKFTGLLQFLFRQLSAHEDGLNVITNVKTSPVCAAGSGEVTQKKRERGVGNNHFLLYHLLGMHDDEGSSSTDRVVDPENNARRMDFHMLIIKKVLSLACKGAVTYTATAASAASSPMASTNNTMATASNGNGGDMKPTNAPPHIPAAVVRVMEYLLRLASMENRTLLLLRMFDPSSIVFSSMEESFKSALRDRRSVSADALCGHVRLLKAVLACVCGPVSETSSTAPPMSLDIAMQDAKDGSQLLLPMHLGPKGIDSKVLALAAKTLTLDRELISVMLDAYHGIGGTKKHSLFHSTIRSLFQSVASSSTALADSVQTFFLLKYRDRVPTPFIRSVERRMFDAVVSKLDVLAVVGRARDSLSPALLNGVSHLDISVASSSPGHSPMGKYLSVDELAMPADAKQMEDVAAFPRRLRQAIGRLSPTPRLSQVEEEVSANRASSPLIPIPKSSSISPTMGTLANNHHAVSMKPMDLEKSSDAPHPQPDGTATEPSASSPPNAAKPSLPKQAKVQGGRSNGRQLGDGKPLMKSK